MNEEINKMRTALANTLAAAGRDALAFDPLSAAALAAIPDTSPQQYVVAGTLDAIAKVLPKDVGASAASIEGLTEAQISAGARAMSDYNADTCGVDREDTWKIFGGEFIDEARLAFAAAGLATQSAQQGAQVQDGWISISDRLPELYATVVLLDENRWMNTGSSDHNVNWHGAGYLCEFGQKYWSVFSESRSQCLDAVTHWMPMPPTPADAVAAPASQAQVQADVRDQALEEAALACEQIGTDWLDSDDAHKNYAADYLAKAIRAMKRTASTEGEQA